MSFLGTSGSKLVWTGGWDGTDLEDFPAVFLLISHWCLWWNTNPNNKSQLVKTKHSFWFCNVHCDHEIENGSISFFLLFFCKLCSVLLKCAPSWWQREDDPHADQAVFYSWTMNLTIYNLQLQLVCILCLFKGVYLQLRNAYFAGDGILDA